MRKQEPEQLTFDEIWEVLEEELESYNSENEELNFDEEIR